MGFRGLGWLAQLAVKAIIRLKNVQNMACVRM
jgi:hypothetical protein